MVRLSLLLLMLALGCASSTTPVILLSTLPSDYNEWLVILNIQGLANRNANQPRLWVNATAMAPGASVPLNWPYPEADLVWIEYLTKTKNLSFVPLNSYNVCDVLAALPDLMLSGVVVYNDTTEASKFVGLTAAGVNQAIAVSTPQLPQWKSCLGGLPVLMTIPDFVDDVTAYAWAIQNLLEKTNDGVQVRNSCGDPFSNDILPHPHTR